MVEPLSPVQAPVSAPVPIEVTYDSTTGQVSMSQTSVPIAASTEIQLTLTTTGSAAAARLYGFTISANWPNPILVSFPSDQEVTLFVPVPDTPGGSYRFMPSIQATGAPVANPVTLGLNVTA